MPTEERKATSMNSEEKALLKSFQQSWAKNKYWVMSRSQQSYNTIRNMAKGNDWSIEKQQAYEKILSDIEKQEPTDKTLTTAFQHIWGYFKKYATTEEKNKYKQLISQTPLDSQALEEFLKELSQTYQQEYLLNMTWNFSYENRS